MSSRQRRYDDDDRPQSRGRSHGKGWSFSTIVIVVGIALLWLNSLNDDGSSKHPTHTTTVCTQYFTAGCPGGKWSP